MVAYFADEADRQMLEGLDSRGLGNLRIRDRIATLVRVRIEQDTPHRDAIRRLIALQATPQYAPGALAQLGRTVDHMWHAAGDTATDFNWYTKRGLLAAVYSATLLYWLDDSDGRLFRQLGVSRSAHRERDAVSETARPVGSRHRLDRYADQAETYALGGSRGVSLVTWPILRPSRASALP